MPLPVRSLPVAQNWDCHACTNCCRTYHVRVYESRASNVVRGRKTAATVAGR